MREELDPALAGAARVAERARAAFERPPRGRLAPRSAALRVACAAPRCLRRPPAAAAVRVSHPDRRPDERCARAGARRAWPPGTAATTASRASRPPRARSTTPRKLTAAHRELPLGTVVDVTNVDNGPDGARAHQRPRPVRARAHHRPLARGGAAHRPHRTRCRARRVTIVGRRRGRAHAESRRRRRGALGRPGRILRASSRAPSATPSALRAAGFTVYFEPYEGLTRVKVGPIPRARTPSAGSPSSKRPGSRGSWCRRTSHSRVGTFDRRSGPSLRLRR